MSTLHYELFVPESGRVTLPADFRNSDVIVLKKTPPLPKDNAHWKKQKTLEELRQEQGDKTFTDSARFASASIISQLFDSPESIEEFLRRRKQ